jgi:hypothetical protein
MTEVREIVDADFYASMQASSEAGLAVKDRMNAIPIIGGPLADAGLVLASFISARRGLHRVVYLVVHHITYAGFGSGSTPGEALSQARRCVAAVGLLKIISMTERIKAEMKAADLRQLQERQAFQFEYKQATKTAASKLPSVPRRRRKIFDASEGKCHYCATALTLDGKWHIEHKMPRALMGGNEPSNLVASCTSCNFKKRDKTDVEFIAERAAS